MSNRRRRPSARCPPSPLPRERYETDATRFEDLATTWRELTYDHVKKAVNRREYRNTRRGRTFGRRRQFESSDVVPVFGACPPYHIDTVPLSAWKVFDLTRTSYGEQKDKKKVSTYPFNTFYVPNGTLAARCVVRRPYTLTTLHKSDMSASVVSPV